MKRPYRIWDARAKKHLIGRNYAYERSAHNGALLIARWSKVGESLEVYDARTGQLIGQYTRRLHFVSFMKG